MSEITQHAEKRRRKKKRATTKSHNVYVVELNSAILEKAAFKKANPNHNPEKACLYVGMTGLDPKERYENHKRGHKGSKYVREFGLYLRPRLFSRYNPMTYEQAAKKEVELANELRTKGYAVWQN